MQRRLAGVAERFQAVIERQRADVRRETAGVLDAAAQRREHEVRWPGQRKRAIGDRVVLEVVVIELGFQIDDVIARIPVER